MGTFGGTFGPWRCVWVMFIIGFFLPFFWLIGALMPSRRLAY